MNRILLFSAFLVVLFTLKLSGQGACPNLVTNGDFSAGNSGFTSDLMMSCGGSCDIGTYCVGTNFKSKCNDWPSVSGHGGSGNFLIIDGSQGNNNVDVWKNSFTVAGNTAYSFSFWLVSVYSDPPQSFNLGVLIDGQIIQTLTISQTVGVWQQYTVTWTSTVPKTIQISLRQMTAGLFRDFGIDDISFQCFPCQADFFPEILSQCGNVQFVNNSTGTAPFSWFWNFGDGFTSTLANPSHQYAQCGTYNVCLIMNATGCMDTICHTVTISDNILPVALCGPIGVELNSNCTATVTPGLVDAGSSDNCAIDSMYVSPGILTGCGVFPVTLTVVDWCGNTSTCTTSVQAIEVVPPVIVCPPNITLACDDDLSTATTGSAAATDNCTQNPIINYTDSIFGLFPCDGWVERTWTARDSCDNESSCTQTIVVIDNIPPVLNGCPSDTTIIGTYNSQGICEATIILQSPGATDNCAPSVQVTNNINSSGNASGIYPQGTTTVTWTAVDDCMNSATCSFSVTVQCDSCCTDLDHFVQNVWNAISILANNDSCKATLSIGNLPNCDYLEYVNWGDGQQDNGPFAAGDLVMHTFGGTGTYEICFLAIETDSNGFICFEKYLCDTITLNCGTCIEPPVGLVAWWPMDDDLGDFSAVDTSGTNDGIPEPNGMIGFTDGPDPVPGKVDGALHFVGVPGAYFLEVPDDHLLNFGNNSFSIDAWIKTDMSTQTEPIVDKLGSLNSGYSLSIQGSSPSAYRLTLQLGTGNSVQYLQGPTILSGQWNLVAVTVEAATASFYVCNSNGFNQMQVPVAPYNASNTLPLLIGKNPSNPHWNITIDELEFFTRQLTSIEVESLCNADSLGKCKPKVDAAENTVRNESILVFPNPTTDILNLRFQHPISNHRMLKLSNMWGHVVLEETLQQSSQESEISLKSLPTGMYFLQILDYGVPIWVEKVVKQ